MRVITFNANGIRSAANKGFYNWLKQQNADVVCIQETKAQESQLTAEEFRPQGYYCYYVDAEKKGYSGVAIYSKVEPHTITTKLGFAWADTEGRYLQADFSNFSVVSLYLPSGSSGEDRQAVKFEFLEHFHTILKKIRASSRNFIICGDWNIAHQNIDLKNWRGNQKNSGFLPEERAWLDNVFGPLGYVDTFRTLYPDAEEYTWWSQRGQARAKNVGWRIDYQVVTPGLRNHIKSAQIYRDENFSDHAPLIVDYDV